MSFKKRREEFPLGKDLYGICSQKFLRKRQNIRSEGKWEWSVTMEDIPWTLKCPVTGLELCWNNAEDKRQASSPTFIRLDLSKGFVPGNVGLVSYQAHVMRKSGKISDYVKINRWIGSQT